MTAIRSAVLFVLASTLWCGSAAGAEKKELFSLSEKPSAPRFPFSKERIWPSQPGKPEVCLWDGDRFAALSITIDDNNAPDHAWWESITKELGMKVTWFVITERPGTGGQWGGWSDFKRLKEAGHGIGSHTVTHFGNADQESWKGADWEYAESKNMLTENIPGLEPLVMAYSGGKNSEKHDREAAAKYYIAVRGTTGTPNIPSQIDYLNTCSTSGRIDRDFTDSVLEGTSGIAWLGGGKYLRGWLCTHFHGVNKKAEAETNLRYIKTREDDLWVGLFDEVVRYGQERDTHKLTIAENSSSGVKFDLTDDMRDDIYNIPLTVKLKLDPDWKGARAEQNGKDVSCTVKEHDGALFALVQAVPDAGTVTVKPAL